MSADILVAIVGSSALFTFLQYLITRRDNKKENIYAKVSDIVPIKSACMAILQDRLEHQMTSHLRNGEITVTQLKALTTLLNAYELCDGDDFIHDLYEQVKELPTRA